MYMIHAQREQRDGTYRYFTLKLLSATAIIISLCHSGTSLNSADISREIITDCSIFSHEMSAFDRM